MALTHVTAIRNTLADAVVDAIDVGTTDASGDVKIYAGGVGGTLICTIALAVPPAFGASAVGVATADVTPAPEGTASGTANPSVANEFSVNDRDNAEVFRGTVGTSGTDMVLSSTSISDNDVIRINSFTYTASA